ncbi:hypothetical protein NKG05_08695 [Oerskovia sp. M15]
MPDDVAHAAIAAEYAHVTAPLRRLVDRYGTEICLALSAGDEVPAWVRDALPGCPHHGPDGAAGRVVRARRRGHHRGGAAGRA